MQPKSTFAVSATEAIFAYYASGDEQLLTPILHELHRSLDCYADQKLGVYDHERRQDLVQESLLYILRSLRQQQFRGVVGDHGERVGILSWAKQVCRYRYLEACRNVEPTTPGREEDPLRTLASLGDEDQPEMLSHLPQAEAVLTAATEAVLELEPRLRDAVVQVFYQGLSHREAAARLGLRLSTFRARFESGLQELRSWATRQQMCPTSETYRALRHLDTGDLFHEPALRLAS